jgi:hypothetical protein
MGLHPNKHILLVTTFFLFASSSNRETGSNALHSTSVHASISHMEGSSLDHLWPKNMQRSDMRHWQKLQRREQGCQA